jgi:hypothetical protein
MYLGRFEKHLCFLAIADRQFTLPKFPVADSSMFNRGRARDLSKFTEDGCGALRKIVRLHMAEHSAHICLTSDAVSAFMRAQRHEMTRQLYDDESLRPLLSYFFSLRA